MTMPFAEYKDFDKCVKDALDDDFDTKYALKVNSTLPGDVGITSTTDLHPTSATNFASKLNFKWSHPSGFSIDKLEMTSRDKITMETSLTDVIPGMNLVFTGVDTAPGTLGAVYSHKIATISTEIDVCDFSKLKVEALGGSRGVLAGMSANFSFSGKFDVTDYSACLGYRPNEKVFVGLRANNKGTDIDAAVQYSVKSDLVLSTLVNARPNAGTHTAQLGVSYQCCPSTVTKFKAGSSGMLNASVKKSFSNDLVMVAAAAVDVHNPKACTFGLTATMG